MNKNIDNSNNKNLFSTDDLKRTRIERILHELMKELETQRNKVLFADAVSASSDSILVRDFAKKLKQGGVEIGETRLFEWFRGNGYLIRQPGGRNMPTQKSMELGVIEIKETVNINAYGRSTVTRTPKITPKGQAYFFAKTMEDKDRINTMEAEKKEAKRIRDNEARRAKRSQAC